MRVDGIVLLASVLMVMSPSRAPAQARDADSTTFRAGQWGAEFSFGAVNASPSGAGLLRFISPRHALLLDLTGQVSHQSGGVILKEDRSSLFVRAGSRWYRHASHHVLQHLTFGAVVSLDQRETEDLSPPQGTSSQSKSTSTGVGAFAELGGSWSVTPQLSLGAAWQGNVLYSRGTQRTLSGDNSVVAPDMEYSVIGASIGALVLRAGVYF